jgi:hypothetical protein
MLSVGLPGAWLLGPMVAEVGGGGANGGSIRVSPILFLGAQAVVDVPISNVPVPFPFLDPLRRRYRIWRTPVSDAF